MLERREVSRDDRSGEMSPITAGAIGIGSAVLGLATGWILYSHFGIEHSVPLDPAIGAPRVDFISPTAGRLSYYVDRSGEGPPLLLIHSINAAASAYEMHPLFSHYRQARPTYALDLPGYGFSERSDRKYSPELFTRAIVEMLNRIDRPTDVVALSLGAEFAAHAALRVPDRLRSLTLISPTGLSASSKTQEGSRAEMIHSILTVPLWARPLFDLLTTRASIRYYLGKSFTGQVPDAFVDYAYATAHQVGAQHAPYYFLSGQLFTPNVRSRAYANLNGPTLILYNEDPFVSFDALPGFVASRSNWQAQRILDTRGLPHFDRLSATVSALDTFWEQV